MSTPHHQRNAQFLAGLDQATRQEILGGIASHYGITEQQALAEVTQEGCEHLLDYVVEPLRTAASVLMQAHGLRGY